jgi:hypothetical protein
VQVKQQERDFEQIGQKEVEVVEEEESDAYSLFVYAMRSQVTET